MKKNIFLSLVLLISMVVSVPQAMAQKQSRVEKLLKSLNENDLEKLQKSRDKLDEETEKAYSIELELIDVMNEIWNNKSEEAASRYFGCYDRAVNASFPDICREEKLELSALSEKTDKMIVDILDMSNNKFAFSRTLIDSIHKTSYPMNEAILHKIMDVRELAVWEQMEKKPFLALYALYSKEYPNGKFKPQMYMAVNTLLYNAVKDSLSEANFKAFFDNPDMPQFYKSNGSRPYMQEVCLLYDDWLYKQILSMDKDSVPAEIKKRIDNYKTSAYLGNMSRKHLKELEYLSEKVDFELLKPMITSSNALKQIKEFLLTHKYKEFRDKANALRLQFESQMIVSTPVWMKFYNQGLLMKSTQTDNDNITSTSYSYNEKGQPLSITTIKSVKGQDSSLVTLQTNFFYDAQGRCALEVQVDTKSKTELYRRSRTFTPVGILLADSLKYMDGKLVLSNYDPQGRLKEEKEYNKNGEILSMAFNKYNDMGWKIESQRQNMASAGEQMAKVLSQKEKYEYNEYGYLIKSFYERIMSNNEKTTGSLTYIYDEYGNPIDGNSYYEYDDTGQWICKMNQSNPNDVERIQYIYK